MSGKSMLSLLLSPGVEPVYPLLEEDGDSTGESFFPLQRELSILPPEYATPLPPPRVMLPPPFRRTDASTIYPQSGARRSLFNANDQFATPAKPCFAALPPAVPFAPPHKKQRVGNSRTRPVVPCSVCSTTYSSNKTLKKGVCKDGEFYCRLASSDRRFPIEKKKEVTQSTKSMCLNNCGKETNGSSQICSRRCLIFDNEDDQVDIVDDDDDGLIDEMQALINNAPAVDIVALHPQHGCLAAVDKITLLMHSVSRLREMVDSLARGEEDVTNISSKNVMITCPECKRIINIASLLPPPVAGGILMSIK